MSNKGRRFVPSANTVRHIDYIERYEMATCDENKLCAQLSQRLRTSLALSTIVHRLIAALDFEI